MTQKRNAFAPAFKAKIGCAAMRENKAVGELAVEHGVHPTQINLWKKTIMSGSHVLFENKRSAKKDQNVDVGELQRLVGELTMQVAWFKKKFGIAN